MIKKYDVIALGELLIDFTDYGISEQTNPVFEANPGGAPCNVLALLKKYDTYCTCHSMISIGLSKIISRN